MVAFAPLRWSVSYRIIRSIYPPVALFEDIADPADWDSLIAIEEMANPRIRDEVGNLGLVPVARRVSGAGSSIIMGCFTHASPDRPGRFSAGQFGVWYAGECAEVAIAETRHHFERFMRASAEPPSSADFRELIAAVHGRCATATPACLEPDHWGVAQSFGQIVREAGGDGVAYQSVRHPAGQAVALFWPDCIEPPVLQARHLRYFWDGSSMTRFDTLS